MAPRRSQVESKEPFSQQIAFKKHSTCAKVMGRLTGEVNLHIPHIKGDPITGQFILACFEQNGLGRLAHKGAVLGRQSGWGAAQASLLHKYVLIISTLSLLQQLKFNSDKLITTEAGGAQEKFIGDGTLVSLATDDPRFLPMRHKLLVALYNRARKSVPAMHAVLNTHMKEIHASAIEARPVDLQDLGSRIAIKIIGRALLGFKHFPLNLQRDLIQIVNDVVKQLPNPLNAALVSLETTIKNLLKSCVPTAVSNTIGNLNHFLKHRLGIGLSATPHLDRLVIKGEKILIQLIELNPETTLKAMRQLLNEPSLTLSDLKQPKYLSIMKLILAGGFETTGKTLRDSMIRAQNPANHPFIEKIRNGLEKVVDKLGKPPEAWNAEDITKLTTVDPANPSELSLLAYLQAYVLEVFRMNPAFSNLRTEAKTDFSLAPNLSHSKNKEDYIKKFAERSNPENDIFVPEGTLIFTSPLIAHIDEMAHGEDAAEFKPERWLGKNFDLNYLYREWILMTFGNDERLCPGRRFSEQELLLFLSRLFYYFNLHPSGPAPVYDPGFTLELAPGAKAEAIFGIHKPFTQQERNFSAFQFFEKAAEDLHAALSSYQENKEEVSYLHRRHCSKS